MVGEVKATRFGLALVLCLSLPALAAPATPATPEDAFWAWFISHQEQVAKIKTAGEPIADQLAAELHKLGPQLTFEVGVASKPKEIIISADGIVEAFPTVKKIVAAAPKIPGWKVVAFRPRKPMTEVQVGKHGKLSTAMMTFRLLRPIVSGAKVDIAIYVKDRPIDDETKLGAYLLLDSLLGEYDVETRLGQIDLLPGKDAPKGTKPMLELPGLVDLRR